MRCKQKVVPQWLLNYHRANPKKVYLSATFFAVIFGFYLIYGFEIPITFEVGPDPEQQREKLIYNEVMGNYNNVDKILVRQDQHIQNNLTAGESKALVRKGGVIVQEQTKRTTTHAYTTRAAETRHVTSKPVDFDRLKSDSLQMKTLHKTTKYENQLMQPITTPKNSKETLYKSAELLTTKQSSRKKNVIYSVKTNDEKRNKNEPIRAEETSPHGRSANQGLWYTMNGMYELFFYTAFYDNRLSLGTFPVIRIIAVAEDFEHIPKLYCIVNYKNQIGLRLNDVTIADIGAGAYRHDKLFREYILNCNLKSEHVPISVGLVYDNKTEPDFMIPVEIPNKTNNPESMVACVSVSYWMIDPYKIIEWVEMQRILGVDKIVVYNNSLSDKASQVFEYYNQTGYLELRQSHNFIDDKGEFTLHLHMSPVINDCMYRNLFLYNYILIIDLDEFLIPRKHLNLIDMLKYVDINEPYYHPARNYIFRNAYFFFDFGADSNENAHLRTMQYRVRLNISDIGYSAKSIITPVACHFMHNHYCWGVNKLYEDGNHMIFVEPEVALLHHYKKCHLDEFEEKKGLCKKEMELNYRDDYMLKFKEKLEPAVMKRISAINL